MVMCSFHWKGGLKTRDCYFGKKPIGDKETFKLLLFCLGNGCSPDLICPWILLSQAWTTPDKAEKRARQVDYVLNNIDTKRHCWFYFDIDYGKMLHLNGLPKEKGKWRPAVTWVYKGSFRSHQICKSQWPTLQYFCTVIEYETLFTTILRNAK